MAQVGKDMDKYPPPNPLLFVFVVLPPLSSMCVAVHRAPCVAEAKRSFFQGAGTMLRRFFCAVSCTILINGKRGNEAAVSLLLEPSCTVDASSFFVFLYKN